MSRQGCAVAAAGPLLLAGVVLAAVSAPATTPASVREAVYFGAAGPLRIRLHVTIKGRPTEAVWDESVAALFAFLDRNKDGVLDAKERSVLDQSRRGREADLAIANGMAPSLRLTFGRKDESVTLKSFAAAIRAAEFEPVRLLSTTARADSAQLSAALFRHLDRDRDGKLSAEELRHAREALAALDINEDELLTAAELLGRADQANSGRPVALVRSARSMEGSQSNTANLLFLTEQGEPAVKQILAARASGRALSLRPSEFGAETATFAALDKDGNGRLDIAELTAWLRQPPDADLAVDFEPGRLSLLPTAKGRPSAFSSEAGGAVIGSSRGTRFRFEPPSEQGAKAAWDAAADPLRKQFMTLAKAKGFVTRKQLENQPGALALFELADRNADGKVDQAEIDSALKVLAPLAACRVEITFVDGGNGLFELLDRNGDGQLSPRELVDAPAVLGPLADAKGRVGPKDLPRRFLVHARAMGIPLIALPSTGADMTSRDAAQMKSVEPVPAWFSKMDRNGDGDVSLHEFLGPLQLFQKLDRDGDGLISPAEARAASR
jgi:Ca2+-binding EF-hand superfamily protein